MEEQKSPPKITDEEIKEQTVENSNLTEDSESEEKKPKAADEFKPLELTKDKVAVVSTDNISEIRKTTVQKTNDSASEIISEQSGPTQIRRMSDSTRAREIEKLKKKKGGKKENNPYSKDRPDGEYMFTPPKFKRKKRTRKSIMDEFESPEGQKNITDIVPSPKALEATRPIEPAPRAERTSIDLAESVSMTEDGIDVHVSHNPDEYFEIKANRKRTKRRVDFNYYGDVEDVELDIVELKNIISSRVILLVLIFIFSLYITWSNQFGLNIVSFLTPKYVYSYLIVHLITGVLAVLTSTAVISKGVKNLLNFKADSDSMTAVTVTACIISLLAAFFNPDMVKSETVKIFMPVGIMSLLVNAVGKYLILRRADRNFDFASSSFDRHGVVFVRNEESAERLTRGTHGDFPILAAMKKTDFLTDFLKYTYSADITDNYSRTAVPFCLIASAILSFFLTFVRMGTVFSADAFAFGFSIFSMFICASSCIGLPFAVNIPLERVSDETLKNDGIMLGYQSVDDLYDANSMLVDAEALFPEKSVKLESARMFTNINQDEAMLEAASLAYKGDSIFKRIFTDIVEKNNGELCEVDNFAYEEGGFCGWIKNRRVLFGGREIMENHNIEGLPTKSKEGEYASSVQEVVYLSISGNIAMMFIVNLQADKEIKRCMQKLAKNKVFLIIKSVDTNLNPKKLSRLFYVPQEMFRIIPVNLHEEFDKETAETERLSASMACTGRFSSFAQLIIGTKVVYSSAAAGLIFQTVSIILGFVLTMLLILSKAFENNYIYMSATAMVIYNTLCALFTIAAVSIKKL